MSMARPPPRKAPMSPSASAARPPSRPGSAAAPSAAAGTSLRAENVRASGLLYTQPASVHFGGFSLDQQSVSQRVFVHNNSAKPVRLQYSFPTKGAFRASVPHDRKPFVSPGLCEEITVTFSPRAFQYYYDCVQIRCEEVAYASNADAALRGSCLLPLHAYPVVNQVAFPTRMDFGAVPVGTTARKHVDLTCSVPIEFEFELQLVKPHAAFTVFPLQGVIPANGAARIEFEFKPLLYATASVEVELMVSQLGFEPLTCTLSGSSASDLGVVSTMEETTGASSPSKRGGQRPRTADRQPPPSPSLRAQPKSPQSPTRRSTSTTKTSSKRSARAGLVDQTTVGAVEIPADLSSMASVNFVLTQQPGKLKPKDLKRAIDANRAMRQQQKDQQNQISWANDENDPTAPNERTSPAVLSFPVLVQEEATAIQRASASRQSREMLFQQELAEIETIEKELEFQSHRLRLGQELLTPEQLAIVIKMREMNTLELGRRQRETLRNDFETKAFHMFTPPTREVPYPPRGMLPAHFRPAIEPDFKTYKNDLWDRRKRVVQRLVRAISTVVYRNRAQKRLEKIQKWLGGATTRAQVRAKVALEWQQHAQQSGGASANVVPASSMTHKSTLLSTGGPTMDAQVYLPGFPIVEEKEVRARDKIDMVASEWDLETTPFAFFPLREREEALVTGHEPLELPPLATYVPLEATRELRTGAFDECSGVSQLATDAEAPVYPPLQDVRVPTVLEMLPRDVFLRPSAAFRPLVRVNSTRETLTTYVLRPQRVFRSTPCRWGLALETAIGSRSLFSLKTGHLRLHERFQPCTERPRGPPALLCIGRDESETVKDEVAQQDDLYRSVWDTSDGLMPPLSQRADDVPYLSDSESDDEDEAKTKRAVPTWEDAVQLWENDMADDDDDGVAYEQGELLGNAQGITCFERYRHLIQSEREYNAYRDEKLQQLPKLLHEVAAKIHHPDYELVVEGHGPSRPLHEPFTTVLQRSQHQHQSQQKQKQKSATTG